MDVKQRAFVVHRLLRARDYQERPEAERLKAWWRDGGEGVCALVGIGGAGKMAITEWFLRCVPELTASDPKLPKNSSLPTPDRCFVFSFYDAPNPQVFLAQMAAWLDGVDYEETAPRPSFYQLLGRLPSSGRTLLVMDGLEKIQDDSARGGTFGRVVDGSMRNFLLNAAGGYLSGISVIITTRFNLYDLEFEGGPLYTAIPIERISAEACRTLLRHHGVRGGDDDLDAIAEAAGRHALTVDLAGGYLAQFCDGASTAPLHFASPEELESAAHESHDPRLCYVAQQNARFARLAQQYRAQLSAIDPAALSLLERICLFRLGVSKELLVSTFTGRDKVGISGTELAALSPRGVKAKIELLVGMRLIEGSPSQGYNVHPAVREGFLRALAPDLARAGHNAARNSLSATLERSSEVELAGRPDADIPPPHSLDLLEEIVYHTLAAGHVKEAFELFKNRFNAIYMATLGHSERVVRLCRAFYQGKLPDLIFPTSDFSEYGAEDLVGTMLICSMSQGDLKNAKECVNALRSKFAIKGGKEDSELLYVANVFDMIIESYRARTTNIVRIIKSIEEFLTEANEELSDNCLSRTVRSMPA